MSLQNVNDLIEVLKLDTSKKSFDQCSDSPYHLKVIDNINSETVDEPFTSMPNNRKQLQPI